MIVCYEHADYAVSIVCNERYLEITVFADGNGWGNGDSNCMQCDKDGLESIDIL